MVVLYLVSKFKLYGKAIFEPVGPVAMKVMTPSEVL